MFIVQTVIIIYLLIDNLRLSKSVGSVNISIKDLPTVDVAQNRPYFPEILYYNIDKQAQFSDLELGYWDETLKEHENTIIETNKKGFPNNLEMEIVNATTIGNIAYIIKYSKNKDAAQAAQQIMDRIKKAYPLK